MLIEATHLLGRQVSSSDGRGLGKVDRLVFASTPPSLVGFQLQISGVIKKYAAVEFNEVLSLDREQIVVDGPRSLSKDLSELDELTKNVGTVLNAYAKTESGKNLGKVSDLLIEAESGIIVRFYVKQFLNERIIPQQYLVSITPRQVVFKDVVDTPIFNQVATASTTA